MALKSKIQPQPILNLKMVQQDCSLQRIANFGNSSVELQVVFEKEKFTIKDSILTRLNEEGKKEENR